MLHKMPVCIPFAQLRPVLTSCVTVYSSLSQEIHINSNTVIKQFHSSPTATLFLAQDPVWLSICGLRPPRAGPQVVCLS